MHTTSILLLALAFLATAAMARPGGKRPGSGHHHGNGGNEGTPGRRWLTYRLPTAIRLPHFLTGTLGQPLPTFTAKKILDGKYLLVSPALLFKLKDVDSGTETSTTPVPESSTTDQPDSVETTTAAVDEETTAEVIEEESTIDAEMEETSTVVPTFLKKTIIFTRRQ